MFINLILIIVMIPQIPSTQNFKHTVSKNKNLTDAFANRQSSSVPGLRFLVEFGFGFFNELRVTKSESDGLWGPFIRQEHEFTL